MSCESVFTENGNGMESHRNGMCTVFRGKEAAVGRLWCDERVVKIHHSDLFVRMRVQRHPVSGERGARHHHRPFVGVAAEDSCLKLSSRSDARSVDRSEEVPRASLFSRL